ncbi:UvrD-helicase domain-containing protein [Clostridium beijerinckii]|uniref:UvrD-helicase domain-containing protein n=1 Tax=Clostridium beijerinckii TaxID=1520 RepID=UPI0023305E07|nr:ATP-dependent helicase [Clostridium beijerinckii]
MEIKSDELIKIEEHFRLSAGPGAGKTYWLVKHIKNILSTSTRLMKSRKIACITYTNIAVETIQKRLGNSSIQVEVSTIHSFLYKNIVKPYVSFISSECGLNIEKLNGHDDSKVNLKKVKLWIENHDRIEELKPPYSVKQLLQLPDNKEALINWLKSLRYSFDSKNNLIIIGDNSKAITSRDGKITRLKNECIEILQTGLEQYKKLYWEEGFIDHDDVLFFSYQLIKKYPFILEILQAKYPYFFVDEFQDTNPIQVELLKMIGNKETIIGIIGDYAQSIYGFQGSDPKQFKNFSLPNLKDYIITDNRRSTNKIIDVLNSIRKDIKQNSVRNVEGTKPIIIVGEKLAAINKAKKICGNDEIFTLSRDNITSNAIKEGIDDANLDSKILNKLMDIDGDSYRRNLVNNCINAVELARYGKYKEALNKLDYLFKAKDKKKKTLKCLYMMLDNYNKYKDKSLMDFYKFIQKNIDNNVAGFRNGKPKTFYDTQKYEQLALCVNIVEDKSNNKTIHKSKGDEFDNVILIINEKELNFLLKPDLEYNEEHRIDYVAISRAKERLFINILVLSVERENDLKELFEVIRI